MLINDSNQVFPVAFLVSSAVNVKIVKAFLDKVKERMGTVKAQIFMSNDDPLFRNAWAASVVREESPIYLARRHSL